VHLSSRTWIGGNYCTFVGAFTRHMFPTRVLVCQLTLCGVGEAQELVLQARDAVAEIVRLFDSTRIVMLGEVHGSIQFDDFLKKLLTTRGFTDRVNDVVIEPANARYQGVLDRFITGEDVSNDQLRPLWEDFVGSPSGAATSPHHGLLTTIRELNRTLPAERKLRVLAGDPPIDWGRVQSRDDTAPFLPFRDEPVLFATRSSQKRAKHCWSWVHSIFSAVTANRVSLNSKCSTPSSSLT
jgi:hypothetical protein